MVLLKVQEQMEHGISGETVTRLCLETSGWLFGPNSSGLVPCLQHMTSALCSTGYL